MFTILVVAPEGPALEKLAQARPSIEILRAHTAEQALEKLGRNRRIDAIVILGPDALATIREIQEEEPAPPPLFTPASPGHSIPGVRALPEGLLPEDLLDEIVRTLE